VQFVFIRLNIIPTEEGSTLLLPPIQAIRSTPEKAASKPLPLATLDLHLPIASLSQSQPLTTPISLQPALRGFTPLLPTLKPIRAFSDFSLATVRFKSENSGICTLPQVL
jgi:hypothetical protein